MKQFVFLYPTEEHIRDCIHHYRILAEKKLFSLTERKKFRKRLERHQNDREALVKFYEEEREMGHSRFLEHYATKINEVIELRYRQKGFKVNYALFNDQVLSPIIQIKPEDKLFYVGMDYKTHCTKLCGQFPYPDNDYILNQLNPISKLVVSGFHRDDCVEKLAKRAYEKGINVLVDEELTEVFPFVLFSKSFNPSIFASFDFRELFKNKALMEGFLSDHKSRPWFWQNY